MRQSVVFLRDTFADRFIFYCIINYYFVFYSALESLVNYAYNGKVQIDSDNVQTLLVAASFLHLQAVKEACCDFLKKRLVSVPD